MARTTILKEDIIKFLLKSGEEAKKKGSNNPFDYLKDVEEIRAGILQIRVKEALEELEKEGKIRKVNGKYLSIKEETENGNNAI